MSAPRRLFTRSPESSGPICRACGGAGVSPDSGDECARCAGSGYEPDGSPYRPPPPRPWVQLELFDRAARPAAKRSGALPGAANKETRYA